MIVLAEGLAEFLPWEHVKDAPVDPHGHISIAHVNFAKIFSKLLADKYKQRMGKEKRITGSDPGVRSAMRDAACL